MIWDPEQNADAPHSAIVSRITAELNAACAGEINPMEVEEVALAVECFLEQEHDCNVASSDHLVMLTSQALRSIGHGAAARRLLVFGTGLVRPAEWEVSAGDRMWVLDLKQITVRSGASLELIFFGSLNMILESVAEIWDETRGRGVLGLRHVFPTLADLLGGNANRLDVMAMSEELRATCTGRLEQMGARRRWEDIPRIINLDVQG